MSQNRSAPTIRFLAKKKQPRRVSASSFDDLLFAGPSDLLHQDQAVWRAVILQAVTDAMSLSAKIEAEKTRREALSWLTSNSPDFRTVCDYAGFDAIYLYEQIQQTLINHRRHIEKDPCPNIQAIVRQFDRLMIGTSSKRHTRSMEMSS